MTLTFGDFIKFLVQNTPIFTILGCFWPVLAIFGYLEFCEWAKTLYEYAMQLKQYCDTHFEEFHEVSCAKHPKIGYFGLFSAIFGFLE